MKEELKKELEELSPFLLEMKEKPESLSVPNHFFNNMRLDIMNKVKAEENTVVLQEKPIRESWLLRLKMQLKNVLQPNITLGFASIFAIAILSFLFISKNTTTSLSDNCTSMACVSDEETSQYVEENINDFDEKTVWDAFYEENENTSEAMLENNKKNENMPTNKNVKLENTSGEELDAIVNEMLQNGELSEEEL